MVANSSPSSAFPSNTLKQVSVILARKGQTIADTKAVGTPSEAIRATSHKGYTTNWLSTTGIINWHNGAIIQSPGALPHASADDREFLMTGTTPTEWEAMFGSDAV